jgi:hypothetical protein
MGIMTIRRSTRSSGLFEKTVITMPRSQSTSFGLHLADSKRIVMGMAIDKASRKIVRAITLLIEVCGFEIVKIKPSGSTKATVRLMKQVSADSRPTPSLDTDRLVETKGYFTVNVACHAGLNHMKSALVLLIKESLSLKRTAVVFEPRLASFHNFGKEVDASWDKYVDLDKIVITKNGVTHHVKALKRHVIADLNAFSVLEVRGKHLVTESENAVYQVIVKNSPGGLGSDGVFGHDDFDFDVDLSPSRVVLCHGDHICRQLGEYHSMHVRRGDKLNEKERYPNLEQDTRSNKICETLSRVLPKGSRVYILTDERTPNYFDVLKKDFQTFQYFDFPELKALVEGDCPDNFLLYEIEQLIFARAKTRIHTFTHPQGEPRISLTTDVGWT